MAAERKDRTKLAAGGADVVAVIAPRASLLTALTGTHNDFFFEAIRRGVYGDDITIAFVDTGDVVPVVTVDGLDISVGVDVGVTTASAVLAALRADLQVMALINAVLKAGDTGAGTMIALAATPLAGGDGAETEFDFGHLGNPSARKRGSLTATKLTSHVTGDLSVGDIINGGTREVVVIVKEVQNNQVLQFLPGANLVRNNDDSLQRLEISVPVGQDMRDFSIVLKVIPRTGRGRTTDVSRIWTCPIAAPAAGQWEFATGNEQQQVEMPFNLYPDETAGYQTSYRGPAPSVL